MAGAVLVFDFDKTKQLWNATVIIGLWTSLVLLSCSLNSGLLCPGTLSWKNVMEVQSRGNTVDDFADCLRRVSLHPKIVSVIKPAHASGCDLRIISDVNVFFIKTILKNHGLLDCFSEFNTNPSFVDGEGRLRISPYHDFESSSHGCNICPTTCAR
ncbi:hypothetical protein CRYUN_Cryun02cG0042100 [Craigia yunnanensis]